VWVLWVWGGWVGGLVGVWVWVGEAWL
jgi:hypothetical protein